MIACLGLFQCGGYVQLATTDKLRPYIQSQPIVVQKEKSPADDLSFRVVIIFFFHARQFCTFLLPADFIFVVELSKLLFKKIF